MNSEGRGMGGDEEEGDDGGGEGDGEGSHDGREQRGRGREQLATIAEHAHHPLPYMVYSGKTRSSRDRVSLALIRTLRTASHALSPADGTQTVFWAVGRVYVHGTEVCTSLAGGRSPASSQAMYVPLLPSQLGSAGAQQVMSPTRPRPGAHPPLQNASARYLRSASQEKHFYPARCSAHPAIMIEPPIGVTGPIHLNLSRHRHEYVP